MGSNPNRVQHVRVKRLPDLNREEQLGRYGFADYGRYGLLRSGEMVLGGIQSSHPATTKIGWYWAVDGDGALIVSGRGVDYDREAVLRDHSQTVSRLVQDLMARRVIPRSGYFRL